MREFILNQLKKCTFANLSDFDETTQTFKIKKYSQPKYEINKCYIIQLAPEIVNNTASPLAVNWNNCTSPKSGYLKIYVNKTMGRMIYIDSIGFDINTKQDLADMWSGWLSIDAISQIAEVQF